MHQEPWLAILGGGCREMDHRRNNGDLSFRKEVIHNCQACYSKQDQKRRGPCSLPMAQHLVWGQDWGPTAPHSLPKEK